jgi:hypothetical protein
MRGEGSEGSTGFVALRNGSLKESPLLAPSELPPYLLVKLFAFKKLIRGHHSSSRISNDRA